jgi:hypothetical protein
VLRHESGVQRDQQVERVVGEVERLGVVGVEELDGRSTYDPGYKTVVASTAWATAVNS